MTRSKAAIDEDVAQEIVLKPYAQQLLDNVQDDAFKPSPQVQKLEFVSVSLTLSTLVSCCLKLNNFVTSFTNDRNPQKY